MSVGSAGGHLEWCSGRDPLRHERVGLAGLALAAGHLSWRLSAAAVAGCGLLVAGFGFCLILIVLTVAVVEVVVLGELAPGRDALLAFAPGGQAELTVLALIVGADVAFVVAHHVLRIFVVIMGAPVVARLMRNERN